MHVTANIPTSLPKPYLRQPQAFSFHKFIKWLLFWTIAIQEFSHVVALNPLTQCTADTKATNQDLMDIMSSQMDRHLYEALGKQPEAAAADYLRYYVIPKSVDRTYLACHYRDQYAATFEKSSQTLFVSNTTFPIRYGFELGTNIEGIACLNNGIQPL